MPHKQFSTIKTFYWSNSDSQFKVLLILYFIFLAARFWIETSQANQDSNHRINNKPKLRILGEWVQWWLLPGDEGSRDPEDEASVPPPHHGWRQTLKEKDRGLEVEWSSKIWDSRNNRHPHSTHSHSDRDLHTRFYSCIHPDMRQ